MKTSLYQAIMYGLCTVAFGLLSVYSKRSYVIVAVLFLISTIYKVYQYQKENKISKK